MKVKKMNALHLRKSEHYQLYSEFKALVEDAGAENLKIAPQFAMWLAIFLLEDESFKKITKSTVGDDLNEADRYRDGIFRGMGDANISALNHFNPEIKAAAKRLKIVFDTYGNVAAMSYIAETAEIVNFVQELRSEKFAADVKLVGLEGWLAELETANNAFDRISKERYDETAGRSTVILKETRAKVDAAYRDIVERINAIYLLENSELHGTFITRLNAVIDKYLNIIAIRNGK
jgi:hypothetical protein